jgi:hypothetical protein
MDESDRSRRPTRKFLSTAAGHSFSLLPFVYDGYMSAWQAMVLPAYVRSFSYRYFLQIRCDEIIQSHILSPHLGDRVRLWPAAVAFAQ